MTRDRKALLESYCHALALVRHLKARAVEADRIILAAMEADLGWTIEYLAGGFPPRTRSRTRTIPVDPQKVLARMRYPAPLPLASSERARMRVAAALGVLSNQEREAFLLVVGEGFSLAEVAEFLRVTRSTAQSYLDRARAKLRSHASS